MRQTAEITIHAAQNVTVPITPESKRRWRLMEEDSVTLVFDLAEPKVFDIGDWINDEIFGKFLITEKPAPADYDESTGAYRYTLRFDREYIGFKNHVFMLTYGSTRRETTWKLTDRLSVHLDEVVRNLAILGYTYTYQIAAEGADKAVCMSYDGTSIYQALQDLANVYGCEFWVADNVIHFGKCEVGETVDLDLTNTESISPTRNESEYANRLYVFGSTRNIPDTYRKDLVFTADEKLGTETPVTLSWTTGKEVRNGSLVDSTRYSVSQLIDVSAYDRITLNRPSIECFVFGYSNGSYHEIYPDSGQLIDDYDVSSESRVLVQAVTSQKDLVLCTGKTDDVYFRDSRRILRPNMISGGDEEVPAVLTGGGNDFTGSVSLYGGSYRLSGEFKTKLNCISHLGGNVGYVTYKVYFNNTLIKTVVDYLKVGTGSPWRGELTSGFTVAEDLSAPSGANTLRVNMIITTYSGDQAVYDSFETDMKFVSSGVPVTMAILVNGVSVEVVYNEFQDYGGWFRPSSGTVPTGTEFTIDPQYLEIAQIPTSYYTDTEGDPNSLRLLGERRLMLPEGTPYIGSPMSSEKLVEKVVVFEETYPKCALRITSVVEKEKTIGTEFSDGSSRKDTYKEFTVKAKRITPSGDVDFPFSKAFLSSEPLQLKFISQDEERAYSGGTPHGKANGYLLTGMTFNLQWNETEGSYTIAYNEDYGAMLPNDVLRPKVGDPFILIGWNTKGMPSLGLISDAESELLSLGTEYLAALQNSTFTFDCVMMSSWAKTAGVLGFGQKVAVSRGDVQEVSRVIGYELNLDIPYDSPIYTVGETEVYSVLRNLREKLNAVVMEGSSSGAVAVSIQSGGQTAGGAEHLADLSDVDLEGAEGGDHLIWDSEREKMVIDKTDYVPDTRTVNGKPLSDNVSLTLDDVPDGTDRKLINYFEPGNPSGLIQLKSAYNYLGPRKGLIFDVTAENGVENSPAHLMLRNFGTAQNPNYALYTPYAIVSAKDQVVLGGTPGSGSGGGGVSWLAELMDVKKNLAPSVNNILVWRNNVSRNDGTTAPGWTNMTKATFLSGYATETWVTGQINDILSSVLKFQGTTTTAISDGSTTNPITIDGASYTAQKGDVVLYDGKEYLWQGSAWEQLGDESSWALKTTKIQAGTGLTGGGTLAANRTISLSSASIASLALADTAYQKPSSGIPKTDLASAVQTSLGHADDAYSYFTDGVLGTSHLPALYIGDAQVQTSAQTAQNIGGLGNLTLYRAKSISFMTTPGTGETSQAVSVLGFSSSNNINIGHGAAANGSNTYVNGKVLYLRYGTSRTTGLKIGGEENEVVGITAYLDVIPSANNSKNLGSENAMWKYTYTKRVYLTSSVYIEYDTTGNYVHINAPLVTDGDQIVTGGTPGGGSGGGKNYLHELLDVYGNPGDVKRGDGTTRQGGDLLGYNSSLGLWVAVDKTTVGVTTAGTVNELNAANPLTALRVWSPSVLASWLAGKNFLTSAVTNVAVGTGDNSDNLAITKDGSTSYLTVPYATNVKRFKRYVGTAETGGYDLNTLLSGGGITSQYNSSSCWGNRPDSMSYGGVLQLNPNVNNTLSMQLAWDVKHTAGETGKIWWRDYNSTNGWGSWHILYDNASLLLNGAEGGESTITFYAPTTAGTSWQLLKSGGANTAPAWTSSALGSATKHVYLNNSGVLTEGSAYAGGTKVTLNGADKGATTASFFAPTGAGTAGQVLLSGGANVAPTWSSSALGAANKPVYLNASGVLIEGSACVTLAGAQTITGAKTHSANITLNNGVGLYCKDTNDNSVEAVYMSSSDYLRIGYGNRTSGITAIYGKTFRIGTNDTASGPDIYIGGLSTTHNTDAANIYFHSLITPTGIRNGVKVSAEHVANADRLNLSVYTSKNTTSPYAPSWNKTLEVTYDGKVNVGAPSVTDGKLNVDGAIVSMGDQIIASDERIKRNFKAIELSVEQIASCRAVSFDWATDGHSFGSVAQDWESLVPEAVKQGGIKTLAYGQLALVASINIAKHDTEQDEEIRQLKERVKNLEDEVKRLRAN